jgi:U3 small nucleolar RNA-associated protein 25
MDDGNNVTTKLLTLLNVSATKISKRKLPHDDFIPSEKLNKRKAIAFAEVHVEKEKDEARMEVDKDIVVPSAGAEEEDKEEIADVVMEGALRRLQR